MGEYKIKKFKLIPLLCIILLIFSSISIRIIGVNSKENSDLKTFEEKINFFEFKSKNIGFYSVLETSEEKNLDFLNKPGEPMLPVVINTYSFPIDTKIKNIDFEISEIITEKIDYKIKPAPQKIPVKTLTKTNYNSNSIQKSKIYDKSDIYPNSWFDYDISVGREGDKRVIFLTIRSYPVRYNPVDDSLFKISDINYKVEYEQEKSTEKLKESYNMVIICPKKFEKPLEKLVSHKNSIGVKTFIKTSDEIYFEYDGRDKAEDIKLFIKDALDFFNIKYVLLVGGRDKQKDSWNLPSRYSNTHDKDLWNDTFVTDLYFADIYYYNETTESVEFDDWDSNKNNIFAEWTWKDYNIYQWYDLDKKDILDMYPDVYVGRLACRNIFEVKNVVDKIILYENTVYGSEWLKNTILVGSDTFPPYTWQTEFNWNTTKFSDGMYEIELQSFTEGKSSEIKSVLVFVLNNPSNKKEFLSNIKLIKPDSKNDNIEYSEDIYLEIKTPVDFQFLNDLSSIKYVTNDKYPPREEIEVKLTIKDIDDKVVYNDTNHVYDHYFEGEIVCDLAATYMQELNYNFKKLYGSKDTLRDVNDVNNEIKNGSRFIFLTGHGTPLEWTTHPVLSTDQWIDLYYYQMQFLNNNEKLPVCVVDGCHNSQFDVSLSKILKGLSEHGLKYFRWIHGIDNFLKWTWVPNSWSWNLVKQKNGGFIAAIGNTGLGWGSPGDYCTENSGGYMTSQFFNIYTQQSIIGNNNLGEIHSKTINKFLDRFGTNDDVLDRKVTEEWVLLGDPSLKIGGYE